ncbi:DegT/DnrJ/EryC1/StrS aminotransferase family protein [Yeosuana sp. MJ-SS3]|uniref:DegT/DnrJ/EryC1/StrS aminotransferase family protein n=1 Tax=Gilvirhabdus luticola TaxID=3079858 RepID=A0ABU3U6X6_9FLAO|nr:DegT/DnrJ/EryC1/StrS aminotransferase family protein [Yeosuana sp. MJ-SS3]MDU8886150.1 DegT/DnrJ/EryC1/StrS aminotransferase family protein [Yeosuana sp. MJ-SS3]
MKIPFSPPDINDNVIDEVKNSLMSGWITTGPKVKRLEELVSKYTPSPNTLCVNSATSGLMLALKWFEIGQGDEVIIPAYTYAATALAVIHVGATPIMVDVENDFNISHTNIEKAITKKTKAIIPVDIAGWPCDYNKINDLVKQKNHLFEPNGENQEKLGRILVVSDSAHSIGAKYKNNYIGAATDITVFSFHAVKNVTTAEGGALCINLPKPFNNQEVYDYLRLYTLNGQTKDAFTKSKAGGWKYDIAFAGLKINLPDVLAAIGVAQLPNYFENTLPKRRQIFDFYQKSFSDNDWAILPPFKSQDKVSSCHVYALRINNVKEETRDLIIEKITEKGVAVNVHFQPLPLLTLFKNLGYNIEDFPMAYKNYKGEISLPIYPQLTDNELDHIVSSVKESVELVLL